MYSGNIRSIIYIKIKKEKKMKKYEKPTAEYVKIAAADILNESQHGLGWDAEWLDALGGEMQ